MMENNVIVSSRNNTFLIGVYNFHGTFGCILQTSLQIGNINAFGIYNTIICITTFSKACNNQLSQMEWLKWSAKIFILCN